MTPEMLFLYRLYLEKACASSKNSKDKIFRKLKLSNLELYIPPSSELISWWLSLPEIERLKPITEQILAILKLNPLFSINDNHLEKESCIQNFEELSLLTKFLTEIVLKNYDELCGSIIEAMKLHNLSLNLLLEKISLFIEPLILDPSDEESILNSELILSMEYLRSEPNDALPLFYSDILTNLLSKAWKFSSDPLRAKVIHLLGYFALCDESIAAEIIPKCIQGISDPSPLVRDKAFSVLSDIIFIYPVLQTLAVEPSEISLLTKLLSFIKQSYSFPQDRAFAILIYGICRLLLFDACYLTEEKQTLLLNLIKYYCNPQEYFFEEKEPSKEIMIILHSFFTQYSKKFKDHSGLINICVELLIEDIEIGTSTKETIEKGTFPIPVDFIIHSLLGEKFISNVIHETLKKI